MSKRGRPEIDDSEKLERIADILAADKARTCRSAIIEVVGHNDSTIRRFERKWRTNGDELFKNAKEIRDRRHQDNIRRRKAAFAAPSFARVAGINALQDFIDPPAFRAMKDALESSNSSFKALKDAAESSSFKAMKDTLESSNSSFRALKDAIESSNSSFKAIQDFIDPPVFKAMKNAMNPPALKAIQDFIDPPELRKIHDALDSPAMRFLRGH